MKRTPVTIRDVAKAAGVSVTTVSHALNGKGEVRPSTAERIRAEAQRLGYQPSRSARALRGGGTGFIALVLPRSVSPHVEAAMLGLDYYMQIAAAAASTAFERHCALVLPPPALTTADQWSALAADGVLLCDPISDDPHIDLLESIHTPVVTIERDLGRPDRRWYAAGDNNANTEKVLDHLAARGARRIALLIIDQHRWAWTTDITDTYRRWCTSHDQPSLVTEVPAVISERYAYQNAIDLLAGPDRPDAIYAPSQGYSTGVLWACRELGLSVPDDVMVIGGNDSPSERESTPTVSAVDLHPEQQAIAATTMLLDLIAGTEPNGPVLIESTLHIRESTSRT